MFERYTEKARRVIFFARYEASEFGHPLIEPKLLSEDKDMLEDLLAAAFNDAVRKIAARTQEKYSGLMSGMNLPPGMKLPF